MSQAPRGKHDWIRDHYEKAILLVALIALLVSCVLLVQQVQSNKESAALSLSRIGWKGTPVVLKDTVPFRDDRRRLDDFFRDGNPHLVENR